MKTVVSIAGLFLGVFQSYTCQQKCSLNNMIIEVSSNKYIYPYLNNYYNRNDTVFFRLPRTINASLYSPKISYTDTKNVKRNIFYTTHDHPGKPIIDFTLINIRGDSAQVTIGIDVEGVVGRFKLLNSNTWKIIDASVYEI